MIHSNVGNTDLMYRLLVQGVTDYAIYMIDPNGFIANWNAGAERAKGYSSQEIVGKHFSCFYSAEDRAAAMPERNLEIARAKGRFEDEGWRYKKDGGRFWAHVVIDAIYDDDGVLVGFAKITRDCTEQRLSALRLKATTDNLDLALSNMSQGLCLIDAEKRFVIMSGRFCELLGLEESAAQTEAFVPSVLSGVIGHDAARDLSALHLRSASEGDRPAISEIFHNGRVLLVATRRVASGGWVMTFEDITDRRRIETHMAHMAHHDELTNLLNRAAFQAHLERSLAVSRGQPDLAVFYIDLDRFKPINDTFGHAAGNELLRTVGARLRSIFRHEDTIARVGGDEFAVLVACNDKTVLGRIAKRIIEDMKAPFSLSGVQVMIGASVGVAIATDVATTADTLLINADLALYNAKQQGRNRHSFYQEAMGKAMAARRTLEIRLRHALSAEEFELHYQGIVMAKTGTVTGFEALLRWRSPDLGYVPPSEFISLAEEVGLMPEIGAWVMNAACREAATWPEAFTVAVNVSATQLRTPDFVSMIEHALQSSGLAANRLEVEVTETAMLENRTVALQSFNKLRSLGIAIALDDFGTGYSSLSFIQNFPLTRIKIDRAFVRGLGDDPHSIAIVRAVVSLSESLGLDVTAEGVETEAQRRILVQERCSEAQGFLFSKPQPPNALAPLFTEGSVTADQLALTESR